MRALRYSKTRVSLFATLPLTSLDKIALRSKLRAIGREAGGRLESKGARIRLATIRKIRPTESEVRVECHCLNVT